MYRIVSWVLALVCGAALVAACSRDSTGPTGPNGGDGGDGTARDVVTRRIGAGGGSIELSSGTRVVFPAGAVDDEVGFTVRDVYPDAYLEPDPALGRVVIECTGAVTEFARPVEILVPLPQEMTEADTAFVFGGYIDAETGTRAMLPCSIRMIGGAPYGVLALDHFSTGFLEWTFGRRPPGRAGPLEIPYYGQGPSDYCWAASLQMLTQAVNADISHAVTDFIGALGVDAGGITAFTFRTSAAIASIVRSRTGATPDRSSWDFVNYDQVRNYLKREIGIRGVPVALLSTVWEHVVVVVGYDGNTFLIHDPQSTDTHAIGYTRRSWEELRPGAGMVCVSIPRPLDPERPTVTVNLMNDAIRFVQPTPARIFTFRWDEETGTGYSFQDRGDRVAALPGQVTTLSRSGDIEIVNSSRTAAQTVDVFLDVVCHTKAGARHHDYASITVPPNATRMFSFADIPVDEFRWNAASPGEYSLAVRARVGGALMDEAAILFKIAPRLVEITSMVPDRGPPGSMLTLRGSGFGAIPKFALVKFNGIVAEVDTSSWSDTVIRVLVPENVTTGPVTVTNGEVTQTAGLFTLTQEARFADTFRREGVLPVSHQSGQVGFAVEGSIQFSISGRVECVRKGLTIEGLPSYLISVERGASGTITVSGNATLDRHVFVDHFLASQVRYTFSPLGGVQILSHGHGSWDPSLPSVSLSVSANEVSFAFDGGDDSLDERQVYFDIGASGDMTVERFDDEGELLSTSSSPRSVTGGHIRIREFSMRRCPFTGENLMAKCHWGGEDLLPSP